MIKLYCCIYCDHSYEKKNLLKFHLRIDHEVVFFKEPIFGEENSNSDKYDGRYDEEMPEEITAKFEVRNGLKDFPFWCNYCQINMFTVPMLKWHMNRRHPNVFMKKSSDGSDKKTEEANDNHDDRSIKPVKESLQFHCLCYVSGYLEQQQSSGAAIQMGQRGFPISINPR